MVEGEMVLRDFRLYDGQDDIACDVCIAGAGAAGVAMAAMLAERNHKVVLLEAGGLDYEEATQDPYIGENIGRPYHDLSTARLRFFWRVDQSLGRHVHAFRAQ